MNEVLAMVLAGGRGKRMDILCHVRPKPTLSFAGGFRVIDFSLSNCVHSGIRNIAVLADYQRTQMAEYLKNQSPSFTIDSNWHILGEEKGLALMQKTNQGTIRNSLVSPGSIVLGRVANSVLSPGVRVEEKAIVRNSILMSRVNVGYHSVVDHCILDEDVDISRYCYLGFDAGPAAAEPEITVVGKGALIPNHTAVGRNCTIMPHVGPADFQGKIVFSGTTLAPQPEASLRKRS